MTTTELAADTLLIGLVSISDRASTGVYEDKGIPALRAWFGTALTSPWQMETAWNCCLPGRQTWPWPAP